MELNEIELKIVNEYTNAYPSEEKQIGVLIKYDENNELNKNIIEYLLNDEDNEELINLLESYLSDFDSEEISFN